MKSVHKCEMSEKGPQGWGGENLQFFRFFEKFPKMKKIIIIWQLKYKNSLIWMKSVHKCEMSEKGPQGRGGENLQFFRFFEKFLKMKKIIIIWHQDN